MERHPITFLEKHLQNIKKELENKRYINALLYIHSLIEAVLFEILLYSNIPSERRVIKKMIKNLKTIGFRNLLSLNFLLSNISIELYNRIEDFNKVRNEFVHNLFAYNLDSKKNIKIFEKQIKNGMHILKELSKIYKNKIDEKTKELTS